MIRGAAVPTICPNWLELIFVIGLLNSAWLKMLKKSPRISSFARSRKIAVVLENDMSTLIWPGPRKRFRGRFPYVPNDGFATTCSLEGNILAEGTQVAIGLFESPHWAVEKALGLK